MNRLHLSSYVGTFQLVTFLLRVTNVWKTKRVGGLFRRGNLRQRKWSQFISLWGFSMQPDDSIAMLEVAAQLKPRNRSSLKVPHLRNGDSIQSCTLYILGAWRHQIICLKKSQLIFEFKYQLREKKGTKFPNHKHSPTSPAQKTNPVTR